MEHVIRRNGGSPAQPLEQEAAKGRQAERSDAARGGMGSPYSLSPGSISGLHQTIGNQAVAQMFRAGAADAGAPALQRKVARSGGDASSPETEAIPATVEAQPAQLTAAGAAGDIRRSAVGPAVIQRTLISYPKKGNGQIDEARPKPADLGEANPIFMEYARLLYDDTSAIVEGKQGKGNPGLVEVMKDKAVTASEIQEAFINGIVGSGEWKLAPAAWLSDLRDAIQAQYPEMPDVDTWTNQETIEYCESDADDILTAWLADKVTLAGTKVWEVVTSATAFAAQWKIYLAFVLYEAVKSTFYPIEASDEKSEFKPFIQPFIELISDVNAGKITKLAFSEKYGAPGNRGAEFQVEEPDNLKTKYEDIAVVHTHYADDKTPPNYGHTKPFAKKYDHGYGYTKVNVDKLKAIDDSKKPYNQLP